MVVDRPRWGFMDIILVYLGITGVSIIASLWLLKSSNGPTDFFLYSFGVQFLATVVFVYLFAVLIPHGQWRDLGLRGARFRDFVVYGIIGGSLLIIMVVLMGFMLKYFQPDLPPQQIEAVLRSVTRLPQVLAIVFAATVLAPVAEELFYRGMIYPLFRKHLGPFGGSILAGMIFGLAHWDLWRALPLAIGGALLCYIYEKTDSVLVPMVAHGVWNGFMCLVIYYSVLTNLV
jgi:uncharacterized protein